MKVFRSGYPYVRMQKVLMRRTFLAVGSATVDGNISFGITVNKVSASAANRPTSLEFSINLDYLTDAQIVIVQSILFGLELSEEQYNVKTTGNSLTFSSTLDFITLNQALLNAGISLNSSLSYDIINRLVADKTINLDADLSYNILNQLLSNNTIDFNIEMSQNLIKELTSNLTVTLGTTLNMLQDGAGAGEVNAAITFLAIVNQVQTNVLTGDRAVSLIMNAAAQFNTQLDTAEIISLVLQASDQYAATRGIPGQITLSTELDQSQSNTLDKLLLISFSALMDKNLSTAGSTFGTVITFANTLAANFGTEGDVTGEIIFSTDMGQTSQTNKLTDVSMGFDIDASLITEIHLIVDGQISLSTVMDQTEAKQLLGQSGITFGHIHGLASIGSANFGADITFGTIQNVQISGFIIQFEIYTPDARTLRVYIEDRTILVDGDTRITTIRRT